MIQILLYVQSWFQLSVLLMHIWLKCFTCTMTFAVGKEGGDLSVFLFQCEPGDSKPEIVRSKGLEAKGDSDDDMAGDK